MKARQKPSGDNLPQKDALIALLQQQLNAFAAYIPKLQQKVADLQGQITQRDQQIASDQQIIQTTKQQLLIQQQIISEQDQLIAAQAATLEKNKKELFMMSLLQHELRLLKKSVFGRKSEKFHAGASGGQPAAPATQLTLDLQTDTIAVCKIINARKVSGYVKYKKELHYKLPHAGRHDFSGDMEVQEIILDVPDRPKGSVLIGVEIQKQLACIPMKFFLKITKRLVYMAPVTEEGRFKQLIAPLPPHPIAKCKADISVLTMMTIDKYLYHLPVYRQQQRFKQYGIELKYNTLVNWLNRIADILEPLYQLLLREILVSRYIQMDETRFRVLDNEKKKGKKSHIGWLWLCASPIQKTVAFSYKPGRGNKDVFPLLNDFTGYLQTDGYAAYHRYGKKAGVTHLQCLSHARRYFVEALINDRPRAEIALEKFFAPLYAIEQQCRDEELSYDEVTERRQEFSLPLLNDFFLWLEQQLPLTIPNTPIHKAISYSLTRKKQLMVYITDGMFAIDTNFIENQVRPIALGRRNMLFAGSHQGGRRAAVIYSLLGTCKLQKINASEWLGDVLRRITIHPADKLSALLPQNWKPLPENAVQTAHAEPAVATA